VRLAGISTRLRTMLTGCIPVQWLLANSKQRLRNFLHTGSDLAPFLSDEPAEDGSVAQLLALSNAPEAGGAAANVPTGTAVFTAVGPPAANPLADTQIPTSVVPLSRLPVHLSLADLLLPAPGAVAAHGRRSIGC
jgi:hypothetical protein